MALHEQKEVGSYCNKGMRRKTTLSLMKCQDKEGKKRKTLRTKPTPSLVRLEKTSAPAED